MAKARKVETEYKVELELTQKEAEVLRSIYHYFIGGKPTGPRGVMDGISRALEIAGVDLTSNVTSETGMFLKWGSPYGEL